VPEALVLREETPGSAWLAHGPAASAERLFGFALPAAQRWARAGEWTAYWLGPSAWQLTHPKAIVDYESRRDALIAAGGALFDVSDARIAIRIEGPPAGELLAKGCGIDFDRAAFPPGECRSTLIARIGVLVAREQDPESFTLFVPRSYAGSFGHWLAAGVQAHHGGDRHGRAAVLASTR